LHREVKGDGYTNHCPKCLWSKHVDVNPGDRAAECGGMMKPIVVEGTARKEILIHECIKCGYQKRNKLSKNDNFDEVLKIIVSRSLI
jgi:hypothetical protein